MKIEIEVDGLKCRAECDADSHFPRAEDREAVNTAMYIRLCNEVRAIAFHLIDAKYSSGKIGR